jgi:hypothetical protein
VVIQTISSIDHPSNDINKGGHSLADWPIRSRRNKKKINCVTALSHYRSEERRKKTQPNCTKRLTARQPTLHHRSTTPLSPSIPACRRQATHAHDSPLCTAGRRPPIHTIVAPGRNVKPSRHPSVPNDNHHCTASRRLPNTATAAPSAVVFRHPSTNQRQTSRVEPTLHPCRFSFQFTGLQNQRFVFRSAHTAIYFLSNFLSYDVTDREALNRRGIHMLTWLSLLPLTHTTLGRA